MDRVLKQFNANKTCKNTTLFGGNNALISLQSLMPVPLDYISNALVHLTWYLGMLHKVNIKRSKAFKVSKK